MSCNWNVTTLLKDSDGGVYTAHIYCSKTETINGVEYLADFGYTVSFEPDPTSEDFIPYENLTEEIVLGWAHTGDGDPKTDVERMVEGDLAQIRAAPAPAALPW